VDALCGDASDVVLPQGSFNESGWGTPLTLAAGEHARFTVRVPDGDQPLHMTFTLDRQGATDDDAPVRGDVTIVASDETTTVDTDSDLFEYAFIRKDRDDRGAVFTFDVTADRDMAVALTASCALGNEDESDDALAPGELPEDEDEVSAEANAGPPDAGAPSAGQPNAGPPDAGAVIDPVTEAPAMIQDMPDMP
jgi:hypothetical protein